MWNISGLPTGFDSRPPSVGTRWKGWTTSAPYERIPVGGSQWNSLNEFEKCRLERPEYSKGKGTHVVLPPDSFHMEFEEKFVG